MSSSPPPESAAARFETRLGRFLPRTLTARLIVTNLLLVAVLGIAVGSVTTLALRSFLFARLDDQVISAAQRQQGSPPLPPNIPPDSCVRVVDNGSGFVGFGQANGTLVVSFDSRGASALIISGNSLCAVTLSDVATLARLQPSEEPRTVDLKNGEYRLSILTTGQGTSIVGLPTASVTATVNRLILWELAVTLGGVALAGVIGQALVRRQLMPLKRVAATATAVTRLPLDTGEVGVIERVPAELTDPATEVGQVGAALNSMLGHVEQALDTRHESEQRVRQFLADASHELRTPLSTIVGYAELTRRVASDPAAMTHAMSRIQAESGRMAELVNDLLLLARLDSGRPLEHGDVDVSVLLVEAVNDARVLSTDHGWRLTLPPDPLHVDGDRDRLHQVVSNLLTNAYRHTPEGTVVTVSAAAVPREGDLPHGVLVTVHDDGPGIPESMAGKEFERFSRGDTSRTRGSGGAGLGLSIVHAIVAAHQGAVRITSRPGSTSVEIRLPAHLPGSAGSFHPPS